MVQSSDSELRRLADEMLDGPERRSPVDDAVQALGDAAAGLRRAADLVEDDALAGALIEMSRRQGAAQSAIVRTAVENGIDAARAPDGTLGGVLRRGWMRPRAALSGDRAVVELALDEETDTIEALDVALAGDPPDEVARRVRTARDQVQEGRALLENWTGGEGH
jgi:hypothetical protein